MNPKKIINLAIKEYEEGSALASVLIITTILFLFIGGILSAFMVQSKFIQRDIDQTHAIYSAEKQLYEYFYYKQQKIGQNVIPEYLQTNVNSKQHGLYDLVESKSIKKNRVSTLKTLIGSNADQLLKFAVVLGDTNSALTLTGNPKIVGNMQVGAKGIRNDNFRGIPFKGSFVGKRVTPTDLFESFREIGDDIDSLINHFNYQLLNARRKNNVLLITDDIDSGTFNSFSDSISTVIIQGNFTINSAISFPDFSTILVSDTLKISEEVSGKHLIFYAEKLIELSEKAAVQAQFFTERNIVVKGETHLRYPSILANYFKPRGFETEIPIYLDDKSSVNGLILTVHDSPLSTTNKDYKNIIEDQVKVRGAYFNSGITENKGIIMGTILTSNFQFYESPTSYINWIREGEIDNTQRPEKFVIPISIGDSLLIEVLDWRLMNE